MNEQPTQIVEKYAELDGRHHIYSVNRTKDATLYSFDKRVTWFETMTEAYSFARDTDALMVVDDDPDENEINYQAFVCSLLLEVKELKPGEKLVLERFDDVLLVNKSSTIVMAQASTIDAIELQPQEEGSHE